METIKGIPILDNGKSNIKELGCAIAINALRTMTESLVEMELKNIKPEVMMEKCVWPILQEAGIRFENLSDGDDVPDGGFEFVVG